MKSVTRRAAGRKVAERSAQLYRGVNAAREVSEYVLSGTMILREPKIYFKSKRPRKQLSLSYPFQPRDNKIIVVKNKQGNGESLIRVFFENFRAGSRKTSHFQ